MAVSLVRVVHVDDPFVEVEGAISKADVKRLAKLGFEEDDEGILWCPLAKLGRRNMSSGRIVEVLAEVGVRASVVDEPPAEESEGAEAVEGEPPEDSGGKYAEKIAGLEGLLYQMVLNAGALQARVRHLERLVGRLSDERFPDAGNRIWNFEPSRRYVNEGREVLIDRIRAVPVPATPEEEVRDRVVRHLIERLGYPKAILGTEVTMKRVTRDSADRADIVIRWPADNGGTSPTFAAVIECKRPGWPLNDDVWAQADRYANVLNCRFVAVTDGEVLETRMRDDTGRLVPVDRFPAFHHLRFHSYPARVFDEEPGWARPTFEELLDEDVVDDYDELGIVSPDAGDRLSHYLNLGSLLLDPHEAPPLGFESEGWSLVEDRGLVRTNFGNAGFQSTAYQGLYRSLVIRDPSGSNILPCLRLWTVAYGKNSAVSTMLAIGLQRVEVSKKNHALQLNLDRFVDVVSGKLQFWHDGRLALGEGGGIGRERTRLYVAARAPELIEGERIAFGNLPAKRLIRWKDFLPVLFRLLRYVQLCEEVRAEARRN